MRLHSPVYPLCMGSASLPMMYAATSDDDELVFEMMPASSSELTGLVAQLHRQSEPAVAASSQSHVALMPRAAVPVGAFTVAGCACGQLLFCPLRATDMQQIACNVQLQLHPIPPVRSAGTDATCRLSTRVLCVAGAHGRPPSSMRPRLHGFPSILCEPRFVLPRHLRFRPTRSM